MYNTSVNHEQLPERGLILAQTGNEFAMACIVQSLLLTAAHVARGKPLFHAPDFSESNPMILKPVQGQDLAHSDGPMVMRGFEVAIVPQLGQMLYIVGLHGREHRPFEIQVRVVELTKNHGVVVEWVSGDLPKPGMSGSPALTENGEVVGLLVRAASEKGPHMFYLETVSPLLAEMHSRFLRR